MDLLIINKNLKSFECNIMFGVSQLNILSVLGGRYLAKEEIESFLKEAKIARFCSLNNDGTIHAAPV